MQIVEPDETANVLIFVALAEEYDQLLNEFPPIADLSDDVHVTSEHMCGVEGYRIFSVLSKEMGDAAANDAVESAIDRLSIDLIVCLGIAGSLSGDLKIGDVAVSNEIIDISQNIKISDKVVKVKKRVAKKRKADSPVKTEQIIELSPKFLPVPLQLSASFRFVRSHPLLKLKHAEWVAKASELREALVGDIGSTELQMELQSEPNVEVGPIISGPVVASGAFRKTLKSLDRKVLAVETESAGVFRAAVKAGIPCITVRGVSDHADVNKNALERTTKNAARNLASINAVRYLGIQLSNPKFMRIAEFHRSKIDFQQQLPDDQPETILGKVDKSIDDYLKAMSPEYKHRPNGANLPIPRVKKEIFGNKLNSEDYDPREILEAIRGDRRLYIRIPKSFPNQTLAWSIGQTLLKGDIDGKQILPLVILGEEITPPSKGIVHATGVDCLKSAVCESFVPVVIVSEPAFHSPAKLSFLFKELEAHPGPVVVISRAESPPDQIDRLRADLFLVDYVTAPVPFKEIAAYLEAAFEMNPDEADSVAMRLDDTFSKFRLHTHPAYFVGLQEATIEALISANHRGELIQLAVDGLLSFAVVFDESVVKLSRTTREEFLAELAYEIKVNQTALRRSDVEAMILRMGESKALEVQPTEFLRGYLSVGLLHEADGFVRFSVPYVEAYLLSERLKKEPAAAKSYFDPTKEEFDHFSFDLYIERGADAEVIQNVMTFAKYALTQCSAEENVYLTKEVRPKALSTTRVLVKFAGNLSSAVTKLSSTSSSAETRQEKQRLIDAREAVRGEVASRDDKQRDDMPAERRAEFEHLDRLSRASTLLATMIGSGAERLSALEKEEIANLLLPIYERFLHHWTKNRLSVDFDDVRSELLSETSIERLIEEFGLYGGDKEEVTQNLSTFIDDQEMRLLSGPAGFLFSSLAQYAGVRSLRPTFSKMKTSNEVESIIRDVWLMDVEHNDGKRELKKDLQAYKGSDLLRLVITNHLMYRIFWHHWQRESRSAFVDVAKYSLGPLGVTTDEGHTRKMLAGSLAAKGS